MSRILWLSTENPDREGQGGQRRQFHQIQSLWRRGHDITVLVPTSIQNGRTVNEFATVMRPRVSVRGRVIRPLLARVRRVISQQGWDAIIVVHHQSGWLLPQNSRLSVPVLLDIHNVMSHWYYGLGMYEMGRAAVEEEAVAIRAATAVTTCSAVERDRLIEIHPEADGRTFVAPLGVDPLEWPEEDFRRDEPVVALFGSWGWRPNELGLAWFLAEVWPLVISELPGATALVAGSGVTNVEEWPAGAHFVGRVGNLATFNAQATVLAVPVFEGVGASVKFAEALVGGAAVVATPDAANAFTNPPALVSADSLEWAGWIVERLRRRADEPAPALSRAIALRDLTWDAAVEPIDEWLRTVVSR